MRGSRSVDNRIKTTISTKSVRLYLNNNEWTTQMAKPASGGRPVGVRWVSGGRPVGVRWASGGRPVGVRRASGGCPVGVRRASGGRPVGVCRPVPFIELLVKCYHRRVLQRIQQTTTREDDSDGDNDDSN